MGRKILAILKGILGMAGGASSGLAGAEPWYRIRKTWADASSQKGAFKPYLVRVTIPNLNIRKGPGTDYSKTGKYTKIGTFTIVDEADGKGASKWGLLKSYQEKRDGWVSLDHAKRV